jgi:hypothetical protein
MVGAAQQIEETERKANLVAPQPVRIGRAVAGAHSVLVAAGGRILDPGTVAIVHEDLRSASRFSLLARTWPNDMLARRVRSTTSAPTGRRSALVAVE